MYIEMYTCIHVQTFICTICNRYICTCTCRILFPATLAQKCVCWSAAMPSSSVSSTSSPRRLRTLPHTSAGYVNVYTLHTHARVQLQVHVHTCTCICVRVLEIVWENSVNGSDFEIWVRRSNVSSLRFFLLEA